MIAQRTAVPSCSGCTVLLEEGSEWPARAFNASADFDRVIAMHLGATESAEDVTARIRLHASEFERDGAKLRCAILACAADTPRQRTQRERLLIALASLVDPSDGVLVLECGPDSGLSAHDLIQSVGGALEPLKHHAITFLAGDGTETRRRRLDSGIYRTKRETDHGNGVYKSMVDTSSMLRASA